MNGDPMMSALVEHMSPGIGQDQKVPFTEAEYMTEQEGAQYPFTCGACAHFIDHLCSKVEGPYDGEVEGRDSCGKFWEPAPLFKKLNPADGTLEGQVNEPSPPQQQ